MYSPHTPERKSPLLAHEGVNEMLTDRGGSALVDRGLRRTGAAEEERPSRRRLARTGKAALPVSLPLCRGRRELHPLENAPSCGEV
jgi:hypothetical protein